MYYYINALYAKRFTRNGHISLQMDLQITFIWYFLSELRKLHFNFPKSMKMKTIQRKICRKPFWGFLQSQSGIFFSFVQQIIGSLTYSMRVAESCSRWWHAKDKTVMQYIATLNSLPHREIMLLSSINFFLKQSLFRLQEAEVAAGSCRRIVQGWGRGLKRGYISLFPSGLLFFPLRGGRGRRRSASWKSSFQSRKLLLVKYSQFPTCCLVKGINVDRFHLYITLLELSDCF